MKLNQRIFIALALAVCLSFFGYGLSSYVQANHAKHEAARVAEEKQQRERAERERLEGEAERAKQEAKEAEDRAKREQEQEAQRLHDTFGDKLLCQLSTLGMLDDGHASVSIGNGLEEAIPLGYENRDLVMFVNRKNGTLSIGFRCKSSLNTYVNPHKMIVRLFDANGEYLTHFITAEWIKTPVCLVHPDLDKTACFMGSAHLGGPVIQLREDVNSLQYRINIRDAAFVQRAEFGPYFGGP